MRFTSDHEWVRLEGNIATVGITEHAAEELGDVIYVELPAVGDTFAQGDNLAVAESVKAAADIFA
ncbi:MAG: glycine cleavage system protein H, partial [Bacillota bacterium]